jgi:hypothetical protein
MLRKIINLIKQVYSYFWKKRKHLKITKPKPAHRPILVRPRKECGLVTKPAAWILKQQRLGLTFSPLTWASSSPTRVSRSSEIDGGTRLSQEQNRGVLTERQNPSSFSPRLFLHPSEQRRAWQPRERERDGKRAKGVAPLMSLLVGEWHSPEGERAAVERVCGGALSRGPKSASRGARGPRPDLRRHRIWRMSGPRWDLRVPCCLDGC